MMCWARGYDLIYNLPFRQPEKGTPVCENPDVQRLLDHVSAVGDFYLTNPIARASAVMAECSALAQAPTTKAAE